MLRRHRTTRRRVWAAAIALGVAGVFTGAAAVQAAPVDPDRKGTITVEVSSSGGQGAANPGDGAAGSGSQPVDGLIFEYCPIAAIDLFDGTNEGWQKLRAIGGDAEAIKGARKGQVLGDLALTQCVELPATVAGVARSGAVDQGAYLVRVKHEPTTITKTSEPFVVTVPTPASGVHSDTDAWIYDVFARPKNDVGDLPVKLIQNQPDNGYILGSKIDYQIVQRLPPVADDRYTKLVFSDTLDARLEGTGTPVVKVNASVLNGGYKAVWSQLEGEHSQWHLTVTFTDVALSTFTEGDLVTVDFSAVVRGLGGHGL